MLDENLPAFFLKPSSTGPKHHRDLYLSYHGSEPEPAYTVQAIDPASPSPNSRNCYAAALSDAYNPEVLFGEVLARPDWVQPTLSQEDQRKNGGVPAPPQPVLPAEFTVQLYGPDQQIRVEVKEGKWGGSDSYEFSMPLTSFRTPSGSNLDRGQSDPASLATTPKVNFVWRKEGKISKDLTCFLTGKSTDAVVKKKSKRDPDIAIALWRSMRELTIYEPNLNRLDMEDPKGLEVVLLLSAVVLSDLYSGGKEHLHEAFNISHAPGSRKLSAGGRKLSSPHQTHSIIGGPDPLGTQPAPTESQALALRTANDSKRNSLPKLQTLPAPPTSSRPTARHSYAQPPSQAPPLPDARAAWELDAETARLTAAAEAEARQEKQRRREREKADETERRRLQRMVEDEERQARKQQAQVDKETERLRKLYGVQPIPPRQPPRPQQPQRPNVAAGRHQQQQHHQHRPQASGLGPYMPTIPQRTQVGGGLLAPPGAGRAAVMSGANASAGHLGVPSAGGKQAVKKKSFFGLRSASEDVEGQRKLAKKASAMW